MELLQDLPAELKSSSDKPVVDYYHVTYRFTCPTTAFNQSLFEELTALTSKYEAKLKEFSVNQW